MLADTNFALLCPDLTIKQYCADPSVTEVCCGICPNTGISGLGGHVSLAFSSLSSITAIALSPSSAPTALTTNLIQANAYALVLIGYLLTDTQELGETTFLTYFFHAAYALLLAFSSLIPLTAIAASPPWAVTGQKSPTEKRAEASSVVRAALRELDPGGSSEKERRRLLRHRREELEDALEKDPNLLVDALEESEGTRGCAMIPGSHWMLYLGVSGSIYLWLYALVTGVVGGANNSTQVSLAQPNCTEGLGEIAGLMVFANVLFMALAFCVALAIIFNHLLRDLAKAVNRNVTQLEYGGSPRLVFTVSFLVWLLWMIGSFSLYFQAANKNLLSSLEFSWTFGTSEYQILSSTVSNRTEEHHR
ncbi:hypothetical protein JCM5350_007835 [Sporobolomyces pararoseus]